MIHTDIRPLRPLHVFESWRPVVSGYTTRSWELITAQIRASGFEPRILVTSRQDSYGKQAVDSMEGLGHRLRLVPPSPLEQRLRGLRRFQVDRGHLEQAIERAVAELDADLIHVHWSAGIGRAAANVARKLGLPLVAAVRFDLAGAMMSETVRVPVPGLERVLRNYFEGHLRQAQVVVAAGDSLTEFLKHERPDLADRLYSVSNGVNLQRFQPGPADPELRRKLGLDGKFVIGTTSNMLHYEGLDLFVQAMARVKQAIPDVHALFVGGGTQAEAVRRLADNLGVPATFTGLVPSTEVPSYLRLFDLYVIPRRDVTITRHAGPIKLVEAMASGRAVLGSRVGDISHLLAEGRGRLMEPDSVSALAAALINLASDPKTRAEMGCQARRYAETNLNWANAAQQHRAIYHRVLADSSHHLTLSPA